MKSPTTPLQCPFKVGDRIRQLMVVNGVTVPQGFEVATVTEITRRGFKYDFGMTRPFIPRFGSHFTGHGEEYLDAYPQGAPLLWTLADEEDEMMARAEQEGAP